jgi:hypothetical protein
MASMTSIGRVHHQLDIPMVGYILSRDRVLGEQQGYLFKFRNESKVFGFLALVNLEPHVADLTCCNAPSSCMKSDGLRMINFTYLVPDAKWIDRYITSVQEAATRHQRLDDQRDRTALVLREVLHELHHLSLQHADLVPSGDDLRGR